MMLSPYLAVAVGFLVLVGCGSPAPDLPSGGPTPRSVDTRRPATRRPGSHADLLARPHHSACIGSRCAQFRSLPRRQPCS